MTGMTDVYANIQAGKYENTVSYTANREAYNKAQRLIEDGFYNDCCDEFDLDPGKDSSRKIYQKAYEDGHAYGYAEVYNHMVDLCDFINDYNKLVESERAG